MRGERYWYMETVTIDGVQYEMPQTPMHAEIALLVKGKGLDATLVSPLDPSYRRPDDTMDDEGLH